MHIRIISVGKLRESFLREGEQEYLKRFRPDIRFEIEELTVERHGRVLADAAKEREAKLIESRLPENEYLVALDEKGRVFSSQAFAAFVGQRLLSGQPNFCFVIGGAFGLAERVLERADLVLSFSRLTFPHHLCRLLLIEQLYRAFGILDGTAYHK